MKPSPACANSFLARTCADGRTNCFTRSLSSTSICRMDNFLTLLKKTPKASKPNPQEKARLATLHRTSCAMVGPAETAATAVVWPQVPIPVLQCNDMPANNHTISPQLQKAMATWLVVSTKPSARKMPSESQM